MQPTLTNELLDIHYEETCFFIVQANLDLINSIEKEEYEKAGLIKIGIDLYLTNQSMLLSELNGKPSTEIFKILKDESNYIFNKMNDNRTN